MMDRRRHLAGALGLALLLAACSGGAASGSPAASAPGASAPAPTAVPGTSGSPAESPAPSDDASTGSGGGTGGNPGLGILDPAKIGDLFEPATGAAPDGQPQLVGRVLGAHDVHTAPATKLEAAVDGRHVAIRVSWYGGVEPCSVLADIDVRLEGTTIGLTVKEGSTAAPDTMCIEMAVLKAAVVDMGDLDPGTYTVTAEGDAQPIQVVVAG